MNVIRIVYLCSKNHDMQVYFREEYLRELYEKGRSKDKKHRYQPEIVRKYTKLINLMIAQDNVLGLMK